MNMIRILLEQTTMMLEEPKTCQLAHTQTKCQFVTANDDEDDDAVDVAGAVVVVVVDVVSRLCPLELANKTVN